MTRGRGGSGAEVSVNLSVDIKTLSSGAVCPCPGAIFMYKIMKKKLYKISLLREFFETCNK